LKSLVFKYEVETEGGSEYIAQKMNSYAYCTRFIYKKLEESSDKKLEKYCKNRWSVTDIEYRSIISKAKQTYNSFESQKAKALKGIEDLTILNVKTKEEIAELENKRSRLSVRQLKLLKRLKGCVIRNESKISKKRRMLETDVVFGSKKLMRELGYLNNDKIKNADKIIETKEKYNKKREGHIYVVGEANQKANRFFDFSQLDKRIIIYKPDSKNHIVLKLCRRKDKNIEKLMALAEGKTISITVMMNSDTITLQYDESILNGFHFDKKKAKARVKELTHKYLPEEERSVIAKQVYHELHKELEERKMADKLDYRYIAMDTNPEHQGYAIIDRIEGRPDRIIKLGNFNFKKLTKKSKKSSDDPVSKYFNNKRKHERKEAVCEIFRLIKHYKVGHFVIEDLNFKKEHTNEIRKEFNRKVNNVWDRTMITQMIRTKCTETGVNLIEDDAAYSSLIGNYSNQVFDPIASALEMTRRGSRKYDKGFHFMKADPSTRCAMEAIAKRNRIDVGTIKDLPWNKLHTTSKSFRYRWGEKVGITGSSSLRSHRSRVKHNIYAK